MLGFDQPGRKRSVPNTQRPGVGDAEPKLEDLEIQEPWSFSQSPQQTQDSWQTLGFVALSVLAIAARAEARAILWSECVLDLHDAVDVLQADAKRDGLIDHLGQDRVQQIIADAFHIVRAAPFFISE